MSYQDHIKTCPDCQKRHNQKPTIRIKSAASRLKERKLSELGSIIRGDSYSYPGISYVGVKKTNTTRTKGASMYEKAAKLRELARLIRG